MMPVMYALAGRELESPLVAAAGSVNGPDASAILRDVKLLCTTGIGAITAGSFSLLPRRGNAVFGSRLYHFDPETGLSYNSLGLPNVGKQVAVQLLPQLRGLTQAAGKPLIYSAVPTPGDGMPHPSAQAQELCSAFLAAGADLVELNVSCPNVPGLESGRHPLLGHDFEGMQRLTAELERHVGRTGRLGLKLPPYITAEQRALVPALAEMVRKSGVFTYLVICNTVPDDANASAREQGFLDVPSGIRGISGPAMRETGREQLRLWLDALGGTVEVVSALGIDTGTELALRLQSGAAAGAGVSFLWRSSNWGAAVTKMLDEFAQAITAPQP